jgi:hypothetical protein
LVPNPAKFFLPVAEQKSTRRQFLLLYETLVVRISLLHP